MDRLREEIMQECNNNQCLPTDYAAYLQMSLIIEVLLDCRDFLRKIEATQGVAHWGSKIHHPPQ